MKGGCPGRGCRLRFLAGGTLPAPAPAAPPVSPTGTSSKQSHHEEQQYRAYGRINDRIDHSSTQMDTKPRQQPTPNEGTHYPENKVANDTETCPSHDMASQPSCN